MEAFKIIYSVLGGLGIFFYGMRSMSDSLQAMAGELIKKVINSLTTNRFMALGVGMFVTMLVQSSSVSSVMVVGFVNAGLMNLSQAIGVIFGANIGTTITGWIISIKIGKYGLLLIGLGIFPTLFGKTDKARQIGKMIFGIGMIFFGLEIMSNAFKPLRTMPEFLEAVSYFAGSNYGSYIASMVMGCILTMIIQSSSAMLGITMAMATTGVINFNTAAALVMGENIGTTITALLASVGGTVNAKRAARAHAFFNCLGVIVLMSFFPYYIEFIDWFVPGDPNMLNAAGDKPNIAVHIATSHTLFNVTNSLIFVPFLPQLAAFIIKITPDKAEKEQATLKVLGTSENLMPAMAIVQAEDELKKMIDVTGRSLMLFRECVERKNLFDKEFEKVNHYEKVTDNMQLEITLFLSSAMENDMSSDQSLQCQNIIKMSDELESITDYVEMAARNYMRILKNDERGINGDINDLVIEHYDDVIKYYNEVSDAFKYGHRLNWQHIDEETNSLKTHNDKIRKKAYEMLKSTEISSKTIMSYSDFILALRKIRSHTHNISESIRGL